LGEVTALGVICFSFLLQLVLPKKVVSNFVELKKKWRLIGFACTHRREFSLWEMLGIIPLSSDAPCSATLSA
jgi:hypothetical protein